MTISDEEEDNNVSFFSSVLSGSGSPAPPRCFSPSLLPSFPFLAA
jgi:hypothetical protein